MSYLTKGGVPYGDSEDMTPYERKLALDAIKEILSVQAEQQSAEIDKAKMSQANSAPRSGLTK